MLKKNKSKAINSYGLISLTRLLNSNIESVTRLLTSLIQTTTLKSGYLPPEFN